MAQLVRRWMALPLSHLGGLFGAAPGAGGGGGGVPGDAMTWNGEAMTWNGDAMTWS
jgi:hypothetical protein